MATDASSSTGSAHGRFQVLHNDHLRYLLAAKERCDHLIIGVTQVTAGEPVETSERHRSLRSSNPLTYFERAVMIVQGLSQAGVDDKEFEVVPFPIEAPALLTQYLPLAVTIYTTEYDDWNRHKITTLANIGYDVVVLWKSEHKLISGSSIRASLSAGTDEWRRLVPRSTADLLVQWDIASRIRSLEDCRTPHREANT